MEREKKLILIVLFCFYGIGLLANVNGTNPDSITENQILYNGRIWRNLHYLVRGDQFFLSREFLKGSVTISGKTFSGLLLKYDIYSDELLTPIDSGKILQLNKELIDSFSLTFQDRNYLFRKLQTDSLNRISDYYNVLYTGKTSLVLRFNKKIDKLSVEGKYDEFYQTSRIFIIRNNKFYPVTNRSGLINVLKEHETLLKEFIKKNKLAISEKKPDTFIPVVRYYDSLIQVSGL